ncbi:uncharacterized protein [Fopius arisanus]|uniref:Uncharacterized protein isoform X2 n=1 Tax=Fopius arisanus TaxID=64838 RepID=A0A9R1TZA4_9HYME|nr:PREDICTED: uncharacterized protein LOC105265993 isoform X2 [Fopius arisanus]
MDKMGNFRGKEYLYYLVHFHEDEQEGVFDIALNGWITWVADVQQFFCKFHTGNNEEEKKLAKKLLNRCKSPPRQWRKYPIKIRGGAETYKVALESLKKLEDRPYAFSTSDESYAQGQINKLKKKSLKKEVPASEEEIGSLFSAAAAAETTMKLSSPDRRTT